MNPLKRMYFVGTRVPKGPSTENSIVRANSALKAKPSEVNIEKFQPLEVSLLDRGKSTVHTKGKLEQSCE